MGLFGREKDPGACMVEGSPCHRIARHGAVPADAPPVPDEFA